MRFLFLDIACTFVSQSNTEVSVIQYRLIKIMAHSQK